MFAKVQEKDDLNFPTICTPLPPLNLKHPKPKHFRYSKEVLTVGDEVRVERLNRGLTQWDADDLVGAYRGFFSELEMGKRKDSIYVLYKASKFLGFVPKTLMVDKTTIRGKIYAYRIMNGYPLKVVAGIVGIDKSTLRRFETGKNLKKESLRRILHFLDSIENLN